MLAIKGWVEPRGQRTVSGQIYLITNPLEFQSGASPMTDNVIS